MRIVEIVEALKQGIVIEVTPPPFKLFSKDGYQFYKY